MADHIEDFFPAAANDTWRFVERNSGASITAKYLATVVASRKAIGIELDGVPEHLNPAFFDRMTLTGAGLELNRIRLTKQVVNINPPLVITLDPSEPNKIAVLFPEGTVPVLNDQPPFDGQVTSKTLTPIGGQGKRFEVKLVSKARFGEQVFRATMQFQTGRGLTDYRGDMGGVFFVYERQN